MFIVAFRGCLRPLRAFARVCFLAGAGAVALTGCASFYVDDNTKDVLPTEMAKPADPKPVQLLFEFQTKGTLNTRATDALKAQVSEHVRASALFSAVDSAPVAGGALLSVTLNNIVLTDDAASKGFITGLTFGAAGSQVTDGYICTVSYLAAGQQSAVVKTVRHAIHTTLGSAGAPKNATKAASIDEAVRTMTRQAVNTALNELARDPALAGK